MDAAFDSAPLRQYLLGLQQRIVGAFEAEDGKPFILDAWTRPAGAADGAPQTPAASALQAAPGRRPGSSPGASSPQGLLVSGLGTQRGATGSGRPGAGLQGDGLSRLVEQGHVFERAGCNFSHVKGRALPPSATEARPELAGASFEALGVSLVMHPRNPHVPTVHMNVRAFAALRGGSAPVVWFGGGMDLTPYYGVEEDAVHFHRCCRDALAPFGPALYPRFKQWCDAYFFLKHRGEARGVGGIFFDDFNELGFERSFDMLRAVGDAFIGAYLPIVQRRRGMPYGERERDFQLYRRGRYVEFNLVFDRGTHFGLQSGGRTESILMSMPPLAQWRYDWRPEPGSAEARLYQDFLPPRDWLA